jgi:hypothetical protein
MWIRRSSSSYPQQVIGHIRQKITEFYYKLTPTEHELIFGYMLTRQLSLYQKYKDKTHLLLEFYNRVLLSLQPNLRPEQVHYAVFKETRNNALSAAIESLTRHFETSITNE